MHDTTLSSCGTLKRSASLVKAPVARCVMNTIVGAGENGYLTATREAAA